MSCIVITRGGAGDMWLFGGRVQADEHAIPQFGDAFLCSPSDIARTFQTRELPGMAYRLGDERLRGDLDHAASRGRGQVTPEMLRRLWELMETTSSAPPTDADEILRIVAEDRRATRVSGVTHREDATMAKEATTAAATKTRPIGRSNYASTSKISFGKDKDGKAYGGENNPKRAGSGAHTRFALYKDGMTIAEAKEVGITAGDINWDAKQGFIKIS